MAYSGRWHGPERVFGLHYDLHAGPQDTALGARCEQLVAQLRLMSPDFVQTDCKGHPGYTSWFSQVPAASVSPGVVRDAMEQWRAATRELGLPLHCHYSGIWDKAAAAKFPAWAVVRAPNAEGEVTPSEKMCPRSPYLQELLIPQMLELIDRYGVDGFWVDGDLWGVEPCYCDRCRTAFTAQTGLATAPTDPADADWPAWWNFTRQSFYDYVTAYCDAVHQHKEGVLVCSNWLQTFMNPGEPTVPTDWISGDNAWVWGLDRSRCEARWLSARGKPWDIMLWVFYCSHGMGAKDSPWTAKPPEMLMQEAAVLLSLGGNVQLYENPGGLRDGRLVPWRQRRWAQVSKFVKQRRALCQGAETIPQVAVLHSETHLFSGPTGPNLMWNVDARPVQGAVYALLEAHLSVDVLDEWALTPRLDEFPVIVVPEQHRLSAAMVTALQGYVRRGGRLLLTGAEMVDRFGAEFLGVEDQGVITDQTWHVPAADGTVPLHSATWRQVRPTKAKVLARCGTTPLPDAELTDQPAALLRQVGRGKVAWIPAAVCRDFEHNHYPLTRSFVAAVVASLGAKLAIKVTGPVALDVAYRRQGRQTIIHLVNRSSGLPNQPNNGGIDEIPAVGPVTITMPLPKPPRSVKLAWEPGEVTAAWSAKGGGELTVTVASVRIHGAVVVR